MTTKTNFFEGCSCFKFNNLRLALRMFLKFYTSVAKGLIWGLILTIVVVTVEKLAGWPGLGLGLGFGRVAPHSE